MLYLTRRVLLKSTEWQSVFSRDLHVIGSFSRDLDVYAEQKHDLRNILLSIYKRVLDSVFFITCNAARAQFASSEDY